MTQITSKERKELLHVFAAITPANPPREQAARFYRMSGMFRILRRRFPTISAVR